MFIPGDQVLEQGEESKEFEVFEICDLKIGETWTFNLNYTTQIINLDEKFNDVYF